MDVLQPGDPDNPVSRNQASYIRRKLRRGTATPEETAWLADFESLKSRGSRGASAHRKVTSTYTEEEAARVGEGDSIVAQAAAQGAMVREEGRREDSLATIGLRAYDRAFARQERMVEFMMARMQTLEDAHLEMWARHRDSRMREADAEIELMKAQADADGKPDQLSEMATELLPHLLKQMNKGK
jgi:hypothetical protein